MKSDNIHNEHKVHIPDVEILHVSKNFGNVAAVADISFSAAKGSFTTLLGPSGCGKTTLLRMIAGFMEPDSGCIKICGKDQTGIPPNRRTVGMVFQDYALFPHMTVRSNLEYGLKIRKMPAAARKCLAEETACMLGLADELDRYPHELSGGQQQRVAVGRVIILKPRILLMDEPLSNLDAKLRNRVRDELKELQHKLGITTIYVTHDQEEALSLSDSIAVINHGKLEQMGNPQDIYTKPATFFTADFIGEVNILTDTAGKKYAVRPELISLSETHQAKQTVYITDHETPITSGGKPVLQTVRCTVNSCDYFGSTIRYKLTPLSDTGSTEPDEYTVPAQLIADIPCLPEQKLYAKGATLFAQITAAVPIS